MPKQNSSQNSAFRVAVKNVWDINISAPYESVCLQAVDYFLWAVQRFYEVRRNRTTGEEVREDRFLNMLWPQIGEIHDLGFGSAGGTYYTHQRPLTLEERFGGHVRNGGMS